MVIPYFWSDQYGKKIQMLGHPRPDDDVVKVKDTGEGQWLGLYSRSGVVIGPDCVESTPGADALARFARAFDGA